MITEEVSAGARPALSGGTVDASSPAGGARTPLASCIDVVSCWLGYLTAILLFGMLVIICYDVAMRYVFNAPTIWANELSTYLLVAIAFIGLPYALLKNGHIRVELLTDHLPDATRRMAGQVTGWLGVLFICVATWQAGVLVHENFNNDVRSFSLLTTPTYLPQLPIVAGFFFFGLALAAEVYRLGVPREPWRKLAPPVLALAASGAAFGVGVPAAPAGLNAGFLAISVVVLACSWIWSGARVFLITAGVFVVTGVALYFGRGLPPVAGALLIALLASALLASGMRIALAIGTVGLFAIAFMLPNASQSLITVAERSWDSLDSFTLTAIPMFVLMGAVLMRSGFTDMMLEALMKWVGGVPGGITYASIGACSVFAAVSGSSVATAAAIGMAACPEMIRRGYNPALAYGSVAAGGTLGILIPPSVVMILYGSTVGVPIATLFIAGILPGILLTLLFMLVVLVWTLVDRKSVPRQAEKVPLSEKLTSLRQILPLLILIFSVLGALYAGIATPTEAAALATMASLVLCAMRGRLTFALLRHTLLETVVISSFLLFIVVCASVLAFSFDYQRLPALLVEGVKASNMSPGQVLAVVAIPVVLLGMFLDPIAMIVMTLPVLFPLIVAMGLDPVWFGVVIVLLVEMSLVCPPLGINLIVLRSAAGAKSLKEVSLGAFPFMVMMAIFIVALYYFPEIVTWLPKTMSEK